MGNCALSKLEVKISYKKNSVRVKIASMIDLRMSIIKHFSITQSFNIYHGSNCIKSTNDLTLIAKHEKIPSLTVQLDDSVFKPHESQVRIGNSYGILIFGKYLICPAEKFTEDSIQKHKVLIGENKFSIKKYYQFLDISSLALSKIKKSGRKVECLNIDEDAAESTEDSYIYKGTKKLPMSELGPNKDFIAALVYNDSNIPVSVLSWNGNLIMTPLQLLKDSVQLAINLANLPNESLPVNISGINSAATIPIYTELACYIDTNRIIVYHPSDFGVNFYPIDKNIKELYINHHNSNPNYISITQTPIGLIIIKKQNAWNFNLSTFQKIPMVPSSHEYHAAVLFQESLIVIGGKSSSNVDALVLNSLEWKSMPKLPYDIESPAACSLNDAIYVIGGISQGEPTDCIWKIGKKDDTWEMMQWKLPWTCVGAGAIAIGREIVVFGGIQSEKDKYVVIENGKEVFNGSLGVHATFDGMQCGKVNYNAVIASRQGAFLKYDTSEKKFYLYSIGNHKYNSFK